VLPRLQPRTGFFKARETDYPRPTDPDLEAARRIERSLFPRELPSVPGWEFAALCQPARTVAGDYYDVFETAPGHVAITLGDVSGKGLGPALVAAGLRALVRCLFPRRAPDLSALMKELNRFLLASTPDDVFVTLFLATLDVRTGRLRYINAGHPPPLVLCGPTDGSIELTEGGTVLGILPDAHYRVGELVLEPDTRMAVFSDGLTETMNRTGEMFREDRILQVLRWTWSAPAASVLKSLMHVVQHFSHRTQPADDRSVVVIHRRADASLGMARCPA
jgi:sigma-B regulation protein RsbU (phosphoserine phosphatase)